MRRLLLVLTACLLAAFAARPQDPDEVPADRGVPAKAYLVVDTGGHTAPVTTALFAADGRRLVTTALDKTIQVWDVRRGARVKVLRPPIGPGTQGAIHVAALSPDGRYLAFGSAVAGDDKGEPAQRVFLLDFEDDTLKVLQTTQGMPSLSFSPDRDQKLLAVAQADGAGVSLWDYAQAKQVGSFEATAHTPGVAFSPDGRRLALLNGAGHVSVWKLVKDKKKFSAE